MAVRLEASETVPRKLVGAPRWCTSQMGDAGPIMEAPPWRMAAASTSWASAGDGGTPRRRAKRGQRPVGGGDGDWVCAANRGDVVGIDSRAVEPLSGGSSSDSARGAKSAGSIALGALCVVGGLDVSARDAPARS